MQQPMKHRFGRGTPANGGSCHIGSPNIAEAGALYSFDSDRRTCTVSVENIPDRLDRREIVALFNTLIGDVRSFQDIRDAATARLEITFLDRDSAVKALCMNGYAVAGAVLTVSALMVSPPVTRSNQQATDDRRNLYVLGLPFALTKNEFASLFSKYGTVSHCVILATVDNSSRRRGFVVMSNNDEAKKAMAALTRTQIKGHTIDVSWAVVQRSQGFLDGGDRSMLLDARSHMPSPSPKLQDRYSFASSDTSDSSLGSHDADPASLSTSSLPTPSLLVTNLPTLLFSQAQDLHPLFFPFGHIEKLEIVQVSPLGTMSVVVQYATANVAQEAKDTLGGQLYGSYQIEARFVKAATSCLVDPLYVSSTGLNCFDKASYGACPTMNKPPVQSRVTSGHAGPCCDPDGGDNDTRVLRSDRFGHTNNTFSRYNSLDSKPRQSPLSATPAAFSDVFRDSDNSRSSSTVSRSIPFFELVDHAHQRLSSSRWNLDQNYGLPSRRQFAPPNHMHYNTVYHCQSSNAA